MRRRLSVGLLTGIALMFLLVPMKLAFNLAAVTSPPHVMVVVMENNSYEAIVGNSQLPFINSLVQSYGTVAVTDLTHPSLPNYLGLTSGSIYDSPSDTTPQQETYPGPQFTDELAGAGISWRAYMEDMPVPCDLTDSYSPGNYDVNHNPFMYYDSVRNDPSQCSNVVPFTQFATDLNNGNLPSFIWVTPNLLDDMHDGTYAQADSWTQNLVTQVTASSWWTPSSRIILTWDEGETTEQVLAAVVGSAHNTPSATPVGNLYAILRGLEEAYGVGLLQNSANSNVGDILPLLTGASAPSPSPWPSPSPSPSLSPSPSPSPVASPSPSPSPSPVPVTITRGIYRFASTDFAAISTAGFNATTDGGVQAYGASEAAAGITGMVWVPAYDNSTCTQTMTDAEIAQVVADNVNAGHSGLRYQIGDEPTANGCAAAALYTHITEVVHLADSTAKTWVADDQFQVGNPVVSGVPMKGTVDILAFDVYPCETGACDYSAIDSAVQQIHAAQITDWEFIIQDFDSAPWRWPTPTELEGQFSHWQNAGASGYWVFGWDYLDQDVIAQAGNVAALQTINELPINISSTVDLSVSSSVLPAAGDGSLTAGFKASPFGGTGPYTYMWSFGDGQGSTIQDPSHTFSAPGQYRANLTITDTKGITATADPLTLTVNPMPAVTASTASSAIDALVAIGFTGTVTGGTAPINYLWTFGDGSSSATQDPSHTFASAGTYSIDLVATDAVGVSVAAQPLTITVNPALSAVPSAGPLSGAAKLTVTFSATTAGGMAPYAFIWTFGDGATGSGPTVMHTYRAGTYYPTLTVSDAAGGLWRGAVGAVTVAKHVGKPAAVSATTTISLVDARPASLYAQSQLLSVKNPAADDLEIPPWRSLVLLGLVAMSIAGSGFGMRWLRLHDLRL
ncbi:MAG TPA: PKD domain-containing protein [Candidatus Dormibacteraeota bacterium]